MTMRLRRQRVSLGAVLSLLGAAAVMGWAVVRGAGIRRSPDTKLDAAPLVGIWDWAPTWRLLPAVAIGVGVVWWGGRGTEERPRRRDFALVGTLSFGWTVALAWSQGTAIMIDPVIDSTEYWARVPKLPPATEMLRIWADPLWMRNQPVHLKGHPPGYVLMLKAMAQVGLRSPWAAAALSWLAAAMVAVGLVVVVRLCSYGDTWRRVAPFAIVAPYAVWMGTSADAVFAAFGVWGVVSVAWSTRARSRPRQWLAGVLGGLSLGFAMFLSYGMAPFLVIPGFVILGAPLVSVRSRLRTIAAVAAGGLFVVGVFVVFRFWWFDGLATTRIFYWKGTAKFRPWGYFFVANIANTVIASGPAVMAGLGVVAGSGVRRLRRGVAALTSSSDRIWLLPLGAIIAMAGSNISQLSKGETERIWLPFFVFLVPLTAAVGRRLWARRFWVAVQIVVALVLQIGLVSKW
jgi:methylthioxylose transferase